MDEELEFPHGVDERGLRRQAHRALGRVMEDGREVAVGGLRHEQLAVGGARGGPDRNEERVVYIYWRN